MVMVMIRVMMNHSISEERTNRWKNEWVSRQARSLELVSPVFRATQRGHVRTPVRFWHWVLLWATLALPGGSHTPRGSTWRVLGNPHRDLFLSCSGRAGFPARYHFHLSLGHLPPVGNQSQLLAAAVEDWLLASVSPGHAYVCCWAGSHKVSISQRVRWLHYSCFSLLTRDDKTFMMPPACTSLFCFCVILAFPDSSRLSSIKYIKF